MTIGAGGNGGMNVPNRASGGVLFVGAGGHARVCLEVFEELGLPVAGCLSRDGVGGAALSVAMLGPDSELEERIESGQRDVFVAIGDNRTRLVLLERVRKAGGRLVTVVSPHATCSRTATLGEGTILLPGAIVNAGAHLGDAVIVNTNASIDHDCEVGSGVHVAPGVVVAGGVRLGRGVFVGVGANLIPGVSVGEHATVGAGAVVLSDVEAGVTVAGVPARIIDAEAGPR